MAELELEQNLYGASRLLPDVPYSIRETFDPAGSPSMPLGHNPTTRDLGLTFDVTRDKGHAITFGRTRGGKGVSSIIPALLTYNGSMVVIDPKGENAWITAERRRAMGQRVIILDPWGEVNKRYGSKVKATETVTKFNPLSALDPNDPDFADDVSAIAEAFILQTGNDPHWPDSARELVGGFIAAEVQQNPGSASMRSVRRLLSGTLTDIMVAVDRTTQKFPESVGAIKLAAAFEVDEEGKPLSVKEMASIRSTARTQTGFLDSARLLDSMETDEPPFNLADIATIPTTLYLVLPVDRLKTHGRWLRMILTLAIRAISKLDTPPDPPVVFLLDELGTISPGSGLSMVEQSYGLMAGLGIRIWAFLQDLPQLQRDYPQSWETFLSNSSVIQLLNVAENTTSGYFSQYLGNKTVNSRTGGWTYKQKPWPLEEWQRIWKAETQAIIDSGGPRLQGSMESTQIPAGGTNINVKSVTRLTREDWAANPQNRWVAAEMEAIQNLAKVGLTQQYKTIWDADTQLASRPVMYSWEIEKADASKCILVRPGQENCQLQRFIYYSDPALKPFARPDPKFPDMPIVELSAVVPAAAAPVPPALPAQPAPSWSSAPAPAVKPSQTVGDELADLGKDLGKKAAGAAFSFLKDRINR